MTHSAEISSWQSPPHPTLSSVPSDPAGSPLPRHSFPSSQGHFLPSPPFPMPSGLWLSLGGFSRDEKARPAPSQASYFVLSESSAPRLPALWGLTVPQGRQVINRSHGGKAGGEGGKCLCSRGGGSPAPGGLGSAKGSPGVWEQSLCPSASASCAIPGDLSRLPCPTPIPAHTALGGLESRVGPWPGACLT